MMLGMRSMAARGAPHMQTAAASPRRADSNEPLAHPAASPRVSGVLKCFLHPSDLLKSVLLIRFLPLLHAACQKRKEETHQHSSQFCF